MKVTSWSSHLQIEPCTKSFQKR